MTAAGEADRGSPARRDDGSRCALTAPRRSTTSSTASCRASVSASFTYQLERYALRFADDLLWAGGDILGTYRALLRRRRARRDVAAGPPPVRLGRGDDAGGDPGPATGRCGCSTLGRLERRKGVRGLVDALLGLDRSEWRADDRRRRYRDRRRSARRCASCSSSRSSATIADRAGRAGRPRRGAGADRRPRRRRRPIAVGVLAVRRARGAASAAARCSRRRPAGMTEIVVRGSRAGSARAARRPSWAPRSASARRAAPRPRPESPA